MNLIEAVKSGKRFRRRGGDNPLGLFFNSVADIVNLSQTDIISEDYELKEPSSTISIDTGILKTTLAAYITTTSTLEAACEAVLRAAKETEEEGEELCQQLSSIR